MSRKHSVFHLLATSGNQAPLSAGSEVTDLQEGQIGVFDENTNLSIGAGDVPRNFYIAVGVSTDGSGQVNDIQKSEGFLVQSENITYYTFKPYSASQSMKAVLKDYIADCETEYGVKIQLGNDFITRQQGMTKYVKTFAIKTSCCNDCEETCPSGDGNEITKLLLNQISSDESGLFTAKAIARQPLTTATHGVSTDIPENGEVSKEDLDAVMEFNKTQSSPDSYVYTDIEFTTNPVAVKAMAGYHLSYFYPRQTSINISKVGDFKCNGDVEITQEMAIEQGAGKDLLNIEYFEKGNTVSPYRQSEDGLFNDVTYFVKGSEKYDMITLGYEQKSLGGWLKYLMDQHTLIVVPTGDTTTRNGLLSILDGIAQEEKFDTLLDDAQASTTDETDVELVSEEDSPNLDGIG